MDFFDLLILAAIALPAVLRWLGEQSRKRAPETDVPVQSADADTDVEVESEFERALREISRALGGEPVDTEPQQVPDPAPEPVVETRAERPNPGRQGPEWREESFETRGAETLKRARAEPFRRLKLRRINVPNVVETAQPKYVKKSRLHAILGHAGGARDAIIVSEILRPPLAMRDPDET
jgi:hypothetical protein